LPDGDPYWKDYRGTHLIWVPTDPTTGWKNFYLEMVEGLLEFGFDGIYIDQHQESTESAEHPDINEQMMEMLNATRAMVKSANPNHVICANVMSGAPQGKKGEEFIRRTKIADYGLTESADSDIAASLQTWIERTGLPFFFFSHGTFESHQRKVALAKELQQPLCLFLPTPLEEADPRIVSLYESDLAPDA
jgi:endo-alpha-1,4-polygalactosaminidase (GH114 family)